MCLANPGANTAVCVIVGSLNVVAASLENIAHFRTRPDKKDLEKKSKQVTRLGVSFFFGSVSLRLNGGGRWERGLSNRAQHQKWLPESVDS